MPRQTRQSITDKRKKDAERQARLRAQRRKARIPQTHEMQRVMLEAFSFAWHSRRMALGREGMPLEVRQFWRDMAAFALVRLTERHGYPSKNASVAIRRAVRRRPGHHPVV